MKPASPALLALLATRQFYMVDLFTFVLADGTTTYRFTSSDIDITANGHLYKCGAQIGPYFERKDNRAMLHWSRGLQVDTLVFDVMPGSAQIMNMNFSTACLQGIFDGAVLTLERAFMPTYGDTSPGTVIGFFGRVAEIDIGRTFITFNVNSMTELVNQNMPRNLFQSSCVNTLYDPSCTLNKASFATSTVVTGTSSTVISINATLGAATGYYDLGMVQFTSGLNQGLWWTIKTYTNGTTSNFTLIAPFPNVPQAGDGFTIYPGCDKSQTTCQNKFSNLVNFRGMPYIPEPETSL